MRVRRRRTPGLETRARAAITLAGLPLNLALGAALRRVGRRDPEAFERLGAFRSAAFLIVPTEAPFAFRLEPDPRRGRVTVVGRDDPSPVAARIRGPLVELLGLFDGSQDADSAFFHRSIVVEGDTGAVLALHNALEAAELSLADLLGAPHWIEAPANRALAALLRAARGRPPVAAA